MRRSDVHRHAKLFSADCMHYLWKENMKEVGKTLTFSSHRTARDSTGSLFFAQQAWAPRFEIHLRAIRHDGKRHFGNALDRATSRAWPDGQCLLLRFRTWKTSCSSGFLDPWLTKSGLLAMIPQAQLHETTECKLCLHNIMSPRSLFCVTLFMKPRISLRIVRRGCSAWPRYCTSRKRKVEPQSASWNRNVIL